MYKINRVEIDGFWGSFKLQTDLEDSVNIFIGRNGSGKTTFINMLEAALTADLDLLESLQFSEIRIFLQNNRKSRKIVITKIPDTPFDRLDFHIGRHPFSLPLLPKEADYRTRRVPPKYIEELNLLKKTLYEIVNISWLSVHRELLEDEYREPIQRRTAYSKNPVDRRIEDLTRRFTSYQLQLQSSINNVGDTFRKEVLASMLYSKRFDTYQTTPDAIDLESVKSGLLKTYADLGVLDGDIGKRIDEHIEAIRKSTEKIRSNPPNLTANDVLPLSLLHRTQHIVELSTNTEQQKTDIRKPVNDYLNILGNFVKDKTFSLDPSLSGELLVKKGATLLSLEQLSSGEKQLLILLTESLLQRNSPYIFIADEPELSLHVEWQRNILAQIRFLNSNSQIIVATHSPEIAGKWRDKIINMKDIIHE